MPIDGAASCSVSFEVPAGMRNATLELRDARYPATTAFVLP